MKLVKLTAPNGKAVWINVDMVCTVTDAIDGDHNAATRLQHAGGVQYLKEPPEWIADLLNTETPEAGK